jgi:hypothetical protein
LSFFIAIFIMFLSVVCIKTCYCTKPCISKYKYYTKYFFLCPFPCLNVHLLCATLCCLCCGLNSRGVGGLRGDRCWVFLHAVTRNIVKEITQCKLFNEEYNFF